MPLPRFFVLAPLVCACSSSDPVPAPDHAAAPDAASPCERLAGAEFRSREVFPMGDGPDGPVLDHQRLAFDANGRTYTWTAEGTRTTSSYTCDGRHLLVRGGSLTGDTDFDASYDAERDVLEWLGVEFVRVPER
jgi:hypothetical protein